MLWYLKQLLPLTYRSEYMEGEKKVFCVWKMWFGKCYKIDTYEIVKKLENKKETK